MRTITTHRTSVLNESIDLHADDRDAANGNMSHEYTARIPRTTPDRPDVKAEECFFIRFQHGPVRERGHNGITNEVLMAIVADRLEGAQAGDKACVENEVALKFLLLSLEALKARTARRVHAGTEGTSKGA